MSNYTIFRFIAALAVFLLICIVLVLLAAIVMPDKVTLYTSKDGLVRNTITVLGVLTALGAAGWVAMHYFKDQSKQSKWYQPFLNTIVVIAAVVVIWMLEYGGKVESKRYIVVKVLPTSYYVDGRAGEDVIELLESDGFGRPDYERTVVLAASDDISYDRVRSTMRRLKGFGYKDVALSSSEQEGR